MINDTTTWDNTSIYKSIDDPNLTADLIFFESEISKLETFTKLIVPGDYTNETVINTVKNCIKERNSISPKLYSIGTYLSCLTSVNAKNEKAHKLFSKFRKLTTEYGKNLNPAYLFIKRCPDNVFDEIILSDELSPNEFRFSHERKMKDFQLSIEEEALIIGLGKEGISAWGNLYDKIRGSLKCVIDSEEYGLAQVSGMTSNSNLDIRKKAWHSIQQAWKGQEISACAILNAINGWRIEEFNSRSHAKDLHYLDVSTHQARISRETLDALMETTYKNRSIGHRALRAMAKANRIENPGPWDLLASAPEKEGEGTKYSFKEAIQICVDAFSVFDTEMGEFAQMMYEKNWIDAAESENRSNGAYCTKFFSTREPRVFMTYTGTMGQVITLAHEIGHAYHNWVMRDMELEKSGYPMTLAETASIFAENLVRDFLFKNAKTDKDRFEIAWQDASSAEGMICNIPSRFEFEKNMVEMRMNSELSVDDMKKLTNEAWAKWYEDSLCEYDEMFWATKLHFSIPHFGFYNYPYLFGYLFSLGIYAQKDKMGDSFKDFYKNLLRDTGVMTAEDLVTKYLDKDITKADFWQDSLNIVDQAVTRFENLVQKLICNSNISLRFLYDV